MFLILPIFFYVYTDFCFRYKQFRLWFEIVYCNRYRTLIRYFLIYRYYGNQNRKPIIPIFFKVPIWNHIWVFGIIFGFNDIAFNRYDSLHCIQDSDQKLSNIQEYSEPKTIKYLFNSVLKNICFRLYVIYFRIYRFLFSVQIIWLRSEIVCMNRYWNRNRKTPIFFKDPKP